MYPNTSFPCKKILDLWDRSSTFQQSDTSTLQDDVLFRKYIFLRKIMKLWNAFLLGSILFLGEFTSVFAHPTLNKAITHFHEFEIQQALRLLQRLDISSLPQAKQAKAYLYMGLSYAYLRKRDKGLAFLKKAVRLSPSLALPKGLPHRLRRLFKQARQNVGVGDVSRSSAPPETTPPEPTSQSPTETPPTETVPSRRRTSYSFQEPARVTDPSDDPRFQKPRRTRPHRSSYTFQKPIVQYLGLVRGSRVRLSSLVTFHEIESILRKHLDLPRFISLKVPMGRGYQDFVEKMVTVIAAKSLGIAKMRAAWDHEFQGYTVTSDMLRAVQNNSFFYWAELTGFQVVSETTKKGKIIYRCLTGVKLYLFRLIIFDCSEGNRRKSAKHAEVCQGKTEQQYAGFATPYKTLDQNTFEKSAIKVYSSEPAPAIRGAYQSIGSRLNKDMRNIKEFKLVSPIESTSFHTADFRLGLSEGLLYNQGFEVYVLRTNGERNYRGYIKVRTIGDNRMKMENGLRTRVNVDPQIPFLSRGQIIIARGINLQKGMVMEEYPLLGTSFGVFAGLLPQDINHFGALGLRFTLEWDLSNLVKINEFYFSSSFDASLTFSRLNIVYLHTGAVMKFHFRQFVLGFGARVGASYLVYQRGDGEDSESIFNSVGGEVLGLAEFFFSPHFTLSFRIGFRLHAPILESIIPGISKTLGIGLPLGPWFMLGGFYTI